MGTITLTYSGSPGGTPTTLTAAATISDADAATLFSWAAQDNSLYMAVAANPGTLNTPQVIFNALATQFVNNVMQRVAAWLRSNAAIAPIVITPVASS